MNDTSSTRSREHVNDILLGEQERAAEPAAREDSENTSMLESCVARGYAPMTH